MIVNEKVVARKSFADSGRLSLEAPMLIGAAIERDDVEALTQVQTGFSGCLQEVSTDCTFTKSYRFLKLPDVRFRFSEV